MTEDSEAARKERADKLRAEIDALTHPADDDAPRSETPREFTDRHAREQLKRESTEESGA